MMNSTYDAYHHEQTCGGPELWAGVLQSIWWMYFWWSMIGLMMIGAGLDRQLGAVIISIPYIVMAFCLTIPLIPDCYDCGDAILIAGALVLLCMLVLAV